MATGGYSEFHESISGHRRGGHRGGRSSHFRSRGRGREMSRYQSDMQPNERDYYASDYQNTSLGQTFHDHNYYEQRGRGKKYRGKERGGRMYSDPYQQHYNKDYAGGKFFCNSMYNYYYNNG